MSQTHGDFFSKKNLVFLCHKIWCISKELWCVDPDIYMFFPLFWWVWDLWKKNINIVPCPWHFLPRKDIIYLIYIYIHIYHYIYIYQYLYIYHGNLRVSSPSRDYEPLLHWDHCPLTWPYCIRPCFTQGVALGGGQVPANITIANDQNETWTSGVLFGKLFVDPKPYLFIQYR